MCVYTVHYRRSSRCVVRFVLYVVPYSAAQRAVGGLCVCGLGLRWLPYVPYVELSLVLQRWLVVGGREIISDPWRLSLESRKVASREERPNLSFVTSYTSSLTSTLLQYSRRRSILWRRESTGIVLVYSVECYNDRLAEDSKQKNYRNETATAPTCIKDRDVYIYKAICIFSFL
jgi:hypothetical protein